MKRIKNKILPKEFLDTNFDAAKWRYEDIYYRYKLRKKKVSKNDIFEVVQFLEDNHDASIGINWDIIDMAIDRFI